MVGPASISLHRRIARGSLAILALAGSLFTGCEPESATQARQIEALKNDLEETKRRLTHAQKALILKEDELLLITSGSEAAKNTAAEKDQAVAVRDAELVKLRAELDSLKKSDAVIFGEIRTLQQKGQTAQALARYQKFITDFPKSPLIGSVASAVAELSTSPTGTTAAVRPAATPVDPKRREREFQKNFQDGFMTLPELAPFLRKKSLQQVIALLGPPNQTFNASTELGYAEKAINPATGSRGMLIIGFESGIVSTLRVEYAGKKMTP